MLRIAALVVAVLTGWGYFVSSPPQDQARTGSAARVDEATIKDFAWLAGCWRGTGLGGTCEEVWSDAMAGTMMGTFRLVKDDKIAFYEIMILGKDEKGFCLRVKHFTEGFVSWETKEKSVRFALESVKPNEAVFSGLTMKRSGDKLDLSLRMRSSTGEVSQRPFALQRKTLGTR